MITPADSKTAVHRKILYLPQNCIHFLFIEPWKFFLEIADKEKQEALLTGAIARRSEKSLFFDRELCSKVLKEALLLVA